MQERGLIREKEKSRKGRVLLEISINLQLKLSLLEAEIGKQVGLWILLFYAKQAFKSYINPMTQSGVYHGI